MNDHDNHQSEDRPTPRMIVAKGSAALAEEGARLVLSTAREAIGARGCCRLALSGGSTPRALHERLAAMSSRDDKLWSSIHLYWGDERAVGPEHPDSNYRMARETLIDRVPITVANVHRFHTEKTAVDAAHDYEDELRRSCAVADGEWPVFDFILLGMGDDGHTASLFPQTPALSERLAFAVANPIPKLKTERLTLTFPVLNAARRIVVLVAGAGKADMVARVLMGPRDPLHYPIQGISPSQGEVIWLIDEGAAQALPPMFIKTIIG